VAGRAREILFAKRVSGMLGEIGGKMFSEIEKEYRKSVQERRY
jgi:hypothetical protein